MAIFGDLRLQTPEPQATCVIKHVATNVITPTTGPLAIDARSVGGWWVGGTFSVSRRRGYSGGMTNYHVEPHRTKWDYI